jgi:Tol biopolymer transport system component
MRFVRVISVCMALAATAGARRSAAQDGAWITFLSHRAGENALYRMHPDGSDLQAIFGGELKDTPGLPGGMKWYRQPHWSRQSPDGAYFLSWAVDLGQPLKRYHMPPRFLLHLGRLDGGPTRLITPDSEEVFAWAPDSQRFVYMRSLLRHPATDDHPLPPRSELVIAALDCSGQQVILDRSGIWLPHDWSPDGKRMLVSYKTSLNPQKASYALFELDLDAAKEEMSRARSSPKPPGPKDEDGIPSGGGLRVVLPLARTIGSSIARYAPDGKSIALFGSSLEPPSDDLIDPARYPSGLELRVLDLDGGNSRVLCREPDIFGGPICWSPDGRQVLFARFNDKNAAIKPVLEPPGDIFTIWSIGRDGTNLRRLTTGWCPDWRNR